MIQSRHLLFVIIVCVFICALFVCTLNASEEGDSLISEIEKLAAVDGMSSAGFDESLVERIESNPSIVTSSFLPKLSNAKATEKQLAIYVWAIGIAKDPRSVESIVMLSKNTKSELVRGNCYRALASIDDQKATEFLCSILDNTKDKDMRFNLLNLLSQKQNEAVLSKSEEILKLDPKQYYWQSIFIFGKMGNKAVPFLLTKITDPNANIRTNSITVLGVWLLAKESAQPMRDRYWEEKDTDIRGLILSSLERVIVDQKILKEFFTEVVVKEKESSLKKYAQETIDQVDKMKKEIDKFKKGKKVSHEEFKKQYDLLYKSAGKEGDYKILTTASSLSDEPKLNKLRECILQRNSDECFYDYQKVNNIIMFNRLIQGM